MSGPGWTVKEHVGFYGIEKRKALNALSQIRKDLAHMLRRTLLRILTRVRV